jgi:hypothetical protein
MNEIATQLPEVFKKEFDPLLDYIIDYYIYFGMKYIKFRFPMHIWQSIKFDEDKIRSLIKYNPIFERPVEDDWREIGQIVEYIPLGYVELTISTK